MGILIVVIIITLVCAGIGAGVYVFIFRANHKKEVMANSQMDNTIPDYGAGNILDQPTQTQAPSPMFSASPSQEQSTPVMNDIVQNGSVPQDTFVSDAPQAPVQEATPDLPTVDHSFPGNDLATPEPLVSDMAASNEPVDQEPPSPVKTLDLNQPEAALQGESDMMKAVENANLTPEASDNPMENSFTVPVTKEEDIPAQPEASLGDILTPEPIQSAPAENLDASPEVQAEASVPVQEPAFTPEPAPVETPAPEIPQTPDFAPPTTDIPTPQPPVENPVPITDNAGGEKDTDTKEMPI